MPLPKPKPDEKEDSFISRCMADPTMLREYKDGKQRTAVCYSQWRNRKMPVNEELLKAIKKLAIDLNCTVNDLLEEGIKHLLKKYEKKIKK